MAKNTRKFLTLLTVLCMLVSAVAPQALAADAIPTPGTQTYEENGLTVTVVTDVESIVDGNTTTVIVTITTTKVGTDETGAEVNFSETVVQTFTTVEEADGSVTETEESVTDGTEDKEWDADDYVEGSDADIPEWTEDVPEVEVDLIPGESTEGSAAGTYETTDPEPAEGETDYDYTDTSFELDRTVSAETGEVETTVTESEFDLDSIAPEDYDGKQVDAPGTFQPEGLLGGYGPTSIVSPETRDQFDAQPDAPGYDYQFTGFGDGTNAHKVMRADIYYLRDAETGEVILDENGNPVIDESRTIYHRLNNSAIQFVLTDYAEAEGEADEYYYAYCIDSDTDTIPGAWYTVSNLHDNDYYPDASSADRLRAIVLNGYWGTASGTGSVDQIRTRMAEFYSGDETVTVTDSKGKEVTYRVADIIGALSESEAVAVTQAAIWTYANGSLDVQDYEDGCIVEAIVSANRRASGGSYTREYNTESDARMLAMYEWLLGLPGMSAENTTIVINENNFIDEMALVIGDRVDEVETTDENGETVTSGVYEADFKFTLEFTPHEEDDLIIRLNYIDHEGENREVVRRIAGVNDEDEEYLDITMDDDKMFILPDLVLTEGTDLDFTVRIEGTQVLANGVYVYRSYVDEEAGYYESQTMVGIAEGERDVAVEATVNMSFTVEEEQHTVSHRVWHEEADPVVEITPPPEEELPPPPPPRLVPPPETDEEIIPDEEVPLADVPTTGDSSFLWLLVIAAAALGLMTLSRADSKRKATF